MVIPPRDADIPWLPGHHRPSIHRYRRHCLRERGPCGSALVFDLSNFLHHADKDTITSLVEPQNGILPPIPRHRLTRTLRAPQQLSSSTTLAASGIWTIWNSNYAIIPSCICDE
jgi:hypothetical protein